MARITMRNSQKATFAEVFEISFQQSQREELKTKP